MLNFPPSDQMVRSRKLCDEFLQGGGRKRYVLGRNVYSQAVAGRFPIDGVIDDFSDVAEFHGVPVVRSKAVPRDALVLNAAGGRPLSAKKQLDSLGLESFDYFALYRHGVPGLPNIVFNEGFREDFESNRHRYEALLLQLEDDVSRAVISKLTAFRLTLDVAHLQGFEEKQDVQYFESFLQLKQTGESFVDVGGFDGQTSIEFALRCPDYRSIHLLEPDPENMRRCRERLLSHRDVTFHQCGASDSGGRAAISSGGSTSRVVSDGCDGIDLRRIDDLGIGHATFIKVDTEGFERQALLGMSNLVASQSPRLAISIYHCAGDFWRIPELVAGMASNYQVYVRHYTESIYETVMFFVPRR